MEFDFTSIIDRKGKDAVAVDGLGINKIFPKCPNNNNFSIIPMWIADMNFKTAPSITDELCSRIEHSLYGYFLPTDEYYESIINWHKENNNINDLLIEYRDIVLFFASSEIL